MRTTYDQQLEAIKIAIKQREDMFRPIIANAPPDSEAMNNFRRVDKQRIALNDAYSTIIAVKNKFV